MVTSGRAWSSATSTVSPFGQVCSWMGGAARAGAAAARSAATPAGRVSGRRAHGGFPSTDAPGAGRANAQTQASRREAVFRSAARRGAVRAGPRARLADGRRAPRRSSGSIGEQRARRARAAARRRASPSWSARPPPTALRAAPASPGRTRRAGLEHLLLGLALEVGRERRMRSPAGRTLASTFAPGAARRPRSRLGRQQTRRRPEARRAAWPAARRLRSRRLSVARLGEHGPPAPWGASTRKSASAGGDSRSPAPEPRRG